MFGFDFSIKSPPFQSGHCRARGCRIGGDAGPGRNGFVILRLYSTFILQYPFYVNVARSTPSNVRLATLPYLPLRFLPSKHTKYDSAMNHEVFIQYRLFPDCVAR